MRDDAHSTSPTEATLTADPERQVMRSTTPRDGAALAPGDPVHIGRFRVRRKIGQGGMGVVYEADDPQLSRRVAIKLVCEEHRRREARTARILREAQALAQLSHPNVVQIYDVGTYQGEIYLAMEHVRGQTLSAWMRDAEPGYRARLAVFRDAGRGLAAAHDKGIVHRDFKPDNVIVDSEHGRVLVLDFGIARSMDDEDPDPAAEELPDAWHGERHLTVPGTRMGTPAYMSPEQLRGESADARSDQFSFCVALYEALYGERPFAGTTIQELLDGIERRGVRAEPRGSGVPPWLRRVLVRGLAAEPEARWPSMDRLLHQLERDPMRTFRRYAFGVAVAAGIAGLSYWAATPAARESRCAGASQELAGIWSPAARESIRTAVLATSLPYASETWRTVEAGVDAYTKEWSAAHVQSCQAHERGERSATLLDSSMACLDRQKSELAALLDVFAHADAIAVENAAQAVSRLEPPARCTDRRYLSLLVPPPVAAETVERVRAVRDDLARIHSQELAGRYDAGLAAVRPIVASARELDYPPVLAEALLEQGRLLEDMGFGREAADSLLEAVDIAEAQGHDVLASDTWTALTRITARLVQDPTESRLSERRARAAFARIRGDDERRAALLHAVGQHHLYSLSYADARAALDEAATILGADDPVADMRAVPVLIGLGSVEAGAGQPDVALEHYRRAIEIIEREAGTAHPMVGIVLFDIGLVEVGRGRADAALRAYQRALDIETAVLPVDSPEVATTHLAMAQAEEARGAFDRALAHAEEAAAIQERTLRPDHPRRAEALIILGALHYRMGRYQEALTAQEKVRALYMAAWGPDHINTLAARLNVAEARVALGERKGVMDELSHVLAEFERVRGPDDPWCATPLKVMGMAYLAEDHAAEAIPVLERALALSLPAGEHTPEVAEIRWALARALRLGGRDRARSLELARAALAFYRQADGDATESTRIAAWIAHTRP